MAHRALLAACALALTLPALPARAAGDCPVLLTVGGAITESNRGPVDAFHDPLLDRFGIAFEEAMTFCWEDLVALDQTTLTASYPNWPGEVTASGPSLADFMAAVGADSPHMTVTAFDGYSWEIPAETNPEEVILAIHAEGAPLAIGGRGPVWLFAPAGTLTPEGGDDAGLVWSVMYIEALD